MKSIVLCSFLLIYLANFLSPAHAVNVLFPPVSIIPVPAIEYDLPYPGILPDHPLYILKIIRDRILVILTRDQLKKIHLHLLLADKRIVMGQILFEKGNTELGITTITKGEKYLLNSSIELVKLQNQKRLPPGLADKIDLSGRKHTQLINKIISLAPSETTKRRLTDALGITNQAIEQIASIKQ